MQSFKPISVHFRQNRLISFPSIISVQSFKHISVHFCRNPGFLLGRSFPCNLSNIFPSISVRTPRSHFRRSFPCRLSNICLSISFRTLRSHFRSLAVSSYYCVISRIHVSSSGFLCVHTASVHLCHHSCRCSHGLIIHTPSMCVSVHTDSSFILFTLRYSSY